MPEEFMSDCDEGFIVNPQNGLLTKNWENNWENGWERNQRKRTKAPSAAQSSAASSNAGVTSNENGVERHRESTFAYVTRLRANLLAPFCLVGHRRANLYADGLAKTLYACLPQALCHAAEQACYSLSHLLGRPALPRLHGRELV